MVYETPLKIPEDFSLKEFVKYFVHGALNYAVEEPTRKELYDFIYGGIAEDLGVKREISKEIYHPIHWEFFNNQNGSLLECIVPTECGKEDFVRLKSVDYSIQEVNDFVDMILEEYSSWFQARMANFVREVS